MQENKHDLVVMGAGPAGYVGALRAAQLGVDVACVDENDLLGGTCLRVGCIPSKAMLESSEKFSETKGRLSEHGIRVGSVELDLPAMLKRKGDVVQTLCRGIEGLLKKRKIATYRGRARFAGQGKLLVEGADGGISLSAAHVLIASGSRPATIPNVAFDGDRIGTSTEALSYSEVPGHLVVIGGGYIGLELGSVWNRLGAKVTLLEAMQGILPEMDSDLAQIAFNLFKRQGIGFRLGAKVASARVEDGRCTVECEGQEPIACDRVLVAVGRVPNTANLGLETIGIECDRRGFIHVNENYATSAQGVYAVGDCIGQPMLAHKASEEAVACVEKLVTGYGHVNYEAIPAVVYTHPEIASVGQSERALQAAGREYRKGLFPFRANGRARTLGDVEGSVKILADSKTDRVLGVHIIGPRAGDMIAEAAVAMQFGASSEDIARTCHAHPTLSEAVHEAALAVHDQTLHL